MKTKQANTFIGIAIIVAVIVIVMLIMRSRTSNVPLAEDQSPEATVEQQAEMADLGAELETIDTDFDADLQKLDTELRGI